MVKVLVFIKDISYHPDTGLRFFLNINECSGSYQNMENVVYDATTLTPDDNKIAINSNIESFAETFAINTWGTIFGPGDTVRLIIGVDN